MPTITYSQAINDALHQACAASSDVIVLGQLIDYKPGVFGTTVGLAEQFGTDRIQDFPVSESAMTSTAIGAAVAGLRPVIIHQRLDFMLYSLDAIANWLALWRFKSDGRSNLPVTIRAIVGKGWGQGPQHSKSLHAWFSHLPGLRVAVPSTAYDAKGLLLDSIFGENPTILIEHRGLYTMTDDVPAEPYRVRFGRLAIRRPGRDATVAALGMLVPVALRAAETLAAEGIDVEVLDLRTTTPLDAEGVCESVRKTRRLIVADPAWKSCSVSAEIVTRACEEVGHLMACNPIRVCLPDSHTPMSAGLERHFYPDEQVLAGQIRQACGRQRLRIAS